MRVLSYKISSRGGAILTSGPLSMAPSTVDAAKVDAAKVVTGP